MKRGNKIKFKHFAIIDNCIMITINQGIIIDFCTEGIKITSDEFPDGKWIAKENFIEIIN